MISVSRLHIQSMFEGAVRMIEGIAIGLILHVVVAKGSGNVMVGTVIARNTNTRFRT